MHMILQLKCAFILFLAFFWIQCNVFQLWDVYLFLVILLKSLNKHLFDLKKFAFAFIIFFYTGACKELHLWSMDHGRNAKLL